MVNVALAYLLLLTGGPVGLHLVYLGREKQAWAWGLTGGFFLVGVLRDLFRLPAYVRECNGDVTYVSNLQAEMQKNPEGPKGYWSRFIAQIWLGAFLGSVLGACDKTLLHRLPSDWDLEWALMSILTGLGSLLGVWVIGNISPWRVSLFPPFVTVTLAVALDLLMYDPEEDGEKAQGNAWGFSIFATIASSYARSWQPNIVEDALWRQTKRKSRCRMCWKITKVYMLILLFFPLIGIGAYNYGTLPNHGKDGEERGRVPFQFVVDSFLDKHAADWEQFKVGMGQLYEFIKTNGIRSVIDEIFTDVEKQALETLELKSGADDAAITKQYRKLSKQYHPDRHVKASPEEKEAYQVKFQKIAQAYEVLKKKKNH